MEHQGVSEAMAGRGTSIGLLALLAACLAAGGCGSNGDGYPATSGGGLSGGGLAPADDDTGVASGAADGVAAGPVASGREDAVLSGTVSYQQRIALPRDALVVVTLYDLSGSPTAAVAERRFRAQAQPPLRFELPYERQRIESGHRYGVRARIFVDGALWFINDQPVPVLSSGSSDSPQILVRAATDRG
jgi:putative lipoprotein